MAMARFCRSFAQVRLARQRRRDRDGSFAPLGHLRHGFAADDPAVGIEVVVNGLIVSTQGLGRHAGGGRVKRLG